MTPEAAVEAGYWEDYQDIAANWSSYAVSFNEEGVTVAFSPYEIACSTDIFWIGCVPTSSKSMNSDFSLTKEIIRIIWKNEPNGLKRN